MAFPHWLKKADGKGSHVQSGVAKGQRTVNEWYSKIKAMRNTKAPIWRYFTVNHAELKDGPNWNFQWELWHPWWPPTIAVESGKLCQCNHPKGSISIFHPTRNEQKKTKKNDQFWPAVFMFCFGIVMRMIPHPAPVAVKSFDKDSCLKENVAFCVSGQQMEARLGRGNCH